uniref:Uncharacterized protein n=1 Tax=uncultured Caudovirales phage TaxID=2100421 RepID=A0A6J5LAQ4_9CAUD|nr:hypothetical protein UFOVP114_101 [uncultured Caudovirales phage]
MASNKGSLFAGIKQASITGGNGKFIGPGDWDLKVLTVKAFQSQQVNSKNWFAVECEVMGASENAVVRLQSGEEHPPEIGEEVSWLVDMGQKSALGNVKGFVKAISGKDAEDIDETDAEELCGEDQPAAGVEVHATAWNTKTRDGNDFTVVRWSEPGAEGEPTA